MASSTDLSTNRLLRFLEEADGTRHALPQTGSVTVGCAPASADHVQIHAPQGSSLEERHCVIGRTKTGGLALKDLGSRGGCRVNGELVSTQRLSVGDRLELGDVALFIRDGREEEPEPSLGRLDGYRLERRLGRGGMGDVVLAVQESLDRKVALKLLKMSLAADKDFVVRFQAEAKNAAALSHPHVVHVYDVGVAEGRHYLAMEFMEGGTLEERLQMLGRLDAEEVRRVLFETAQALSYAEERRIVHRDIKPENLMLDTTGRVKLADLGLATESESQDRGGERIMGTPHFMAPEQARGAKPDHRSDLYALGATAFRLLTGHTPFEGETTRDILRAHFTQPVPKPSERVPGVSPALDAVIARLMAKEPGERYGSARELIQALNQVTIESTDAPSKSKAPLLIGLLVVALGAAGAYVALGPKSETPEPAPRGDQGTQVATSNGAPRVDADPLPALPAIPEAGEDVPEDNEAALQELEVRAQNAKRQLEGVTDPEARRTMLLALIKDYPGSSAANDAFIELQALNAQLDAALNAEQAKAKRITAIQAQLKLIVVQAPQEPSGAPSDPMQVLFNLYDVSIPAEPELADAFRTERRATAQALIESAQAEVNLRLANAEQAASEGDFERYAQILQGAIDYLEQHPLQVIVGQALETVDPLQAKPDEDGAAQATPSDPAESDDTSESGAPRTPDGDPSDDSEVRQGFLSPRAQDPTTPDAPPTEAPSEPEGTLTFEAADFAELNELGLDALLQQRDVLRKRLAETQARAEAYHEAQVAADFNRLGSAIYRGPSGQAGLGATLQRGNYRGLATVWGDLGQTLNTTRAQDELMAWSLDAENAATLIDHLVSAFAAGEWRRTSTPAPYGGFAEVEAISSTGITLSSDSGSRALLWSEYRTNRSGTDLPDAFEGLIKSRLNRDYTPLELDGIAALLRLAAVESTLKLADDVLIASDRERFDQGDLEDVRKLFEVALEWSRQADQANGRAVQVERTRREQRAALLLAESLVARTQGEHSISAALASQLLMQEPFSLVVLLLSNGREGLPRR
jgi:serine/threonine protein kinase